MEISIGNFKNGRQNGKGTFFFNGTKHIGNWKDGYYHGEGKLII